MDNNKTNKYSKVTTVLIYAACAIVIIGLLRESTVTYVTAPLDPKLHFWRTALIVGVVLGIVASMLFAANKNVGKNPLKIIWGAQTGMFLLVALFAFFITSFGIDFVNRSFDKSEPTVYEVTILETDYDYNRKSADEYTFEVEIEGELIELYVSDNAYYYHNEGDLITVYKYSGALGHEYYTAHKNKTLSH